MSHYMLRRLRVKQNSTKINRHLRLIPRGFLFEYVSCPHYTFETMSWLAWALLAGNTASYVFVVAVIVVLVIYAHDKHSRYVKYFDGTSDKKGGIRPLYPATRCAFIPFVF